MASRWPVRLVIRHREAGLLDERATLHWGQAKSPACSATAGPSGRGRPFFLVRPTSADLQQWRGLNVIKPGPWRPRKAPLFSSVKCGLSEEINTVNLPVKHPESPYRRDGQHKHLISEYLP